MIYDTISEITIDRCVLRVKKGHFRERRRSVKETLEDNGDEMTMERFFTMYSNSLRAARVDLVSCEAKFPTQSLLA